MPVFSQYHKFEAQIFIFLLIFGKVSVLKMSGLSISDSKTLWVGDIENWMNEDYLTRLFSKTGATVLNVKIIKDKASGLPQGYGFVEFNSHEMAAKVLQLLNQSLNPATNKYFFEILKDRPFRQNWGVYGGGAHVVHNKNTGQTTAVATPVVQAPKGAGYTQVPTNHFSSSKLKIDLCRRFRPHGE